MWGGTEHIVRGIGGSRLFVRGEYGSEGTSYQTQSVNQGVETPGLMRRPLPGGGGRN